MDRRSFIGFAALGAAGLALPELLNPAAAEAAFVKPKYPSGVLWGLTNHAPRVAWTVDDGASETALHNYIEFAHNSGTRITFFVTSNNRPWRSVRSQLLPLVKTGQIQLANHTKSHANLTKLQGWAIRRELNECAKFIHGEYGVDPAPVYRPPFGYYDDRVRREASLGGYRSCAMWYGSLGDGGNITARTRLKLADKWMTAGRIVIAHANEPTSPSDLLKIRRIIDSRGLSTVTLNDIWRP